MQALIILTAVLAAAVVVAVLTRPRLTLGVGISGGAALVVLALGAVALRTMYRTLPEVESLTAEIDKQQSQRRT